jgi:hypothetical protein
MGTHCSRDTALDLFVRINSLSSNPHNPNRLLNMISDEVFSELYQLCESTEVIMLVCRAQLSKKRAPKDGKPYWKPAPISASLVDELSSQAV